MSDFYRGRTALVTGGSSGIGFEIAKLLLKKKAVVVLVASDKIKLERAATELAADGGTKPLYIAKDLSDPQAPQALFDELAARKISVDFLVNNAGFGTYGPFHTTDLQKTQKMIDVNVKALVALTRLFLPGMIVRGFGRVLNVASTASFQPVPIESVYASSKAFVLSFSESVNEELKGSGVGVTCLCPGPTQTAFFERGSFRESAVVRKVKMTADKVAAVGLDALAKRKPLVIAGFTNKLGAFLTRLAPRKFVVKIARKMVE